MWLALEVISKVGGLRCDSFAFGLGHAISNVFRGATCWRDEVGGPLVAQVLSSWWMTLPGCSSGEGVYLVRCRRDRWPQLAVQNRQGRQKGELWGEEAR